MSAFHHVFRLQLWKLPYQVARTQSLSLPWPNHSRIKLLLLPIRWLNSFRRYFRDIYLWKKRMRKQKWDAVSWNTLFVFPTYFCIFFSRPIWKFYFREQVSAAIQQELPKVMANMKLYLQNSSTRTILFKPIK